jgi:hypothetical protein
MEFPQENTSGDERERKIRDLQINSLNHSPSQQIDP